MLVSFVSGAVNGPSTTRFTSGGSHLNGYHYWNDHNNWNLYVPRNIDNANLQNDGTKVLMTGGVTVSELRIGWTGSPADVQLAGTGDIYCKLVILTNSSITLLDTVNINTPSYTFFAGGTAGIHLYDSSMLDTFFRFNNSTLFTVTLNENARIENFKAPIYGIDNILSGSSFVINNRSCIDASTMTARELYNSWALHNTIFFLNDRASIQFMPLAENYIIIGRMISYGCLVINDSPNAQYGIDYTYNHDTGLLQSHHKIDYNVLFNNDTTHITTCESPYHKIGEAPFTDNMLYGNIDEMSGIGVDVFMINPGHTWVPWWFSASYPMDHHYDWYYGRYGLTPNHLINEYVLNGNDLLQKSINRCLQKGLVPFVTYRMNDAQLLQRREDNPPGGAAFYFLSEFYIENVPDYCVGLTTNTRDEMAQNYAIPAVRQHRLDFIREIASYNIKGIELDYFRYHSYFKLDETTSQQRRNIMTGLIRDIRQILDDSSGPGLGDYKLLAVRVPCYEEFYDRIGLDLAAWENAGVDIVIASADYFTVNDSDIEAMAAEVPGIPVYMEIHYTTNSGKDKNNIYNWRRTTDNQFYTAAHLAYKRGAAGVSAYNFQYYRPFGGGELQGPFSEPPFHIFQNIGNPSWVANQPQHYILAETWLAKYYTETMPLVIRNNNEGCPFTIDMAPPTDGWTTDARIRIQSYTNLYNSQWKLILNHNNDPIELKKTDDVSEPYNNPYPNLLDDSNMRRAWIIPKNKLKDGANNFELIRVTGPGYTIIRFIDISFTPPCHEEICGGPLFEINLPLGWSMISLPVIPNNTTLSALFPDAVVMYMFERGVGYVRVEDNDDLEAGRGYWILLNDAQSYSIKGEPIQKYTLSVHKDGWEMIGGCASPAQAAADNCNIGVIYGFDNESGYNRIPEGEFLEPSKGYWILFGNIVEQCNLTVETTGP